MNKIWPNFSLWSESATQGRGIEERKKDIKKQKKEKKEISRIYIFFAGFSSN
jgi:hypothetical protein